MVLWTRARGLATLVLASGVAAAAVVVLAAPASAQTGLDQVGRYFEQDSTDVGGPAFAPQTVSTPIMMGDDTSAVVSLPFTFNYYDQAQTQIRIGSNGALSFGATTPSFANAPLAASAEGFIAPWWDDWTFAITGSLLTGTVGTAPHRAFVVWWKDVPPFGGGTTATASFQAVLHEGTDVIEFEYLDTSVNVGAGGSSGTVGIDHAAVSALQYSFNQASLSDGLAIRFTPARCDGRRATVLGTFGPDALLGTSGDDVMFSLSGNDTIATGGGSDRVCSGKGGDTIDLGPGADRARAGDGNDLVSGRTGQDVLYGERGADELHGGPQRDQCIGGPNPGVDSAAGCEVVAGVP